MNASDDRAKKALIVSSEEADATELKLTLGAFGWDTIAFQNYDDAAEAVAQDLFIDLSLLSVGKQISKSFNFIRSAGSSGRRDLPIILVCDNLPSEINEAFYEGADSVLIRPYTIEYVSKGIESAYATRVGYSNREQRRMRLYRTKASFTFDSTHGKGFATNLSPGGLFIGTTDLLPPSGKIIQFKISSEADSISLNGFGVVRWVRNKLEFGKPRGFGIKFEALSRSSEATLKSFLD
jgi:CheY-like chemotaxis protein